MNFVRLPPVDRAATMAKGAGLRVVADASVDLSLYDDTPKTLTYEVRRMGDALCGLPWASTRSGVTIEQVRPRPVQGELSACVFTISADGGALLREAGDASRVALDFGVMTSFTRGDAVHELVIDAERVSFTNTSRLPFFRTSANTLDVISENGVRRIGGQLEWQITQGDRRVAGFDVGALHLRCGAADPVDLTPVGEVELVSRADTSEQSRLRLQVIGGMPTGVAGAQSCTVSVEGTARFSAAPSGVRYADQVIQLPEQRRLLTFPAAPSGATQPNPPQGSSSMSQYR